MVGLTNRVLLGVGRYMVPIPRVFWQPLVRASVRKTRAGLGFLSEDHHRVRDFAVRELVGAGAPLRPEAIAEALDLELPRARSILDDLEAGKTFLFRGDGEAVSWAYPVTVDETPHSARFSTGEEAYSPWAIDTFAMPFVQGHLRSEPIAVTIESACGHCGRALRIEIQHDLRYRVLEGGQPLIFLPIVDFEKIQDPSIIHDFWEKSVFFWSEEHAREDRRRVGGGRGLYLTLDQATFVTPLAQGALFGFPRG